MRSSRTLGVLAGTTAVAFVTLVVATPASAATLPDGQRITIVEYQDSSDLTEGQFFDVSPADAASTPIGTPTEQAILGLEVNDEGIGYAIGQLENETTIWAANANTGTLTDPHTIVLTGDVELDSCGGIDLVNDFVIIACVEADNNVTHIGSVDPATGILTSFLSLADDDSIEFNALANDVVTAQLWGFANAGGVSYSYTIDLENDIVVEVAEMDNNVFAADFDRNGQLFVSTEEAFGVEFEIPALAVADPFTGAYSFIEPYVSTTTDTALLFVASLTIWGSDEPALANTGTDVAPLALGTALLLLVGAAFVATSRVNRRNA